MDERSKENQVKRNWRDNIAWVLIATVLLYMGVAMIIFGQLFNTANPLISRLIDGMGENKNTMVFIVDYYLVTLSPFLFFLIYTRFSKRNRFVFDSFVSGTAGNKISNLLKGILVGFIMNFGCIVIALLHGDIKLIFNFTASQIPIFIFAFICVFIQSSSEEMWCRGFMYDRLNVRYPLWVAILVNSLFFAALHIANPGASAIPIIDIATCGLAFSIAKWYTGSIWFPMGIHTMWNFTQNFLFGLPNSGLVSEASVYSLDAAEGHGSLLYNYDFGVEGAIPAVIADVLLAVICLYLAYRKGRLGELKQVIGPQLI